MKAKYLILLLLLGCKKVDKSVLKSEPYKDLIGTWTTNYPNDEARKIIIYDNGKVEIYKSTERGEKFRIIDFKYEPGQVIFDGDTLNIYSMSSRNDNESNGYVRVLKKIHSDSAYFGSGLFIHDFEMDTNVNTFKVIYTRN